MKFFREKTTKVVDKIYCDMCGQSCTITEPYIEHEYAKIEATWGYFSNQDGAQYDIEICESCFNQVLSFIKDKRRRNLGPFKYPYDKDPLEGQNYMP